MPPKISAAGDRGLLVELEDVTARQLHAWAAAVRSRPGVRACVAGQQSLYILFDGPADRSVVPASVTALDIAGARHEIPLSIDPASAPDLPEFLAHARLDRSTFLSRLGALTFTVRFLGFRGGFGYLDGWPVEWAMPRRPTSRPVARGSFAIAGSVAGIYPVDSPGGWNILGRTPFDLEHRLRAGDEIVLRIIETSPQFPLAATHKKAVPAIDGVKIDGPFAQVVTASDESRLESGWPAGGPFDPIASALANRLVGNAPDDPSIECALVRPRIVFDRPRLVAWCGADGDLPAGQAFMATEIASAPMRRGLRGYLAVSHAGRKGALTSRDSFSSQDSSRESPARSGDERESIRAVEREALLHHHAIVSDERRSIRVAAGPHECALREVTCEVTAQLDRIGIRLRPLEPIDLPVAASLPSIGMQFGTIQLHPDGSMVAMGPDHPVTGGYLQPMTVLTAERWKLGQLMPGDIVRFGS